jgi:hypothetical protein
VILFETGIPVSKRFAPINCKLQATNCKQEDKGVGFE